MGIRNELAAKARNRRSQVIRSWWHYAYGVVAYDIQKRKRRRDNFKDKYVSFDWDRQKQKRKQYIDLYLGLDLDVGHHIDCDASLIAPEAEDLLRIEDQLPIEQLLLYRSIARALHMHGMRSMPSTVEVLYRDYASSLSVENRASMLSALDQSTRVNKRFSMHEMATQHQAGMDDVDEDNPVSEIFKQ